MLSTDSNRLRCEFGAVKRVFIGREPLRVVRMVMERIMLGVTFAGVGASERMNGGGIVVETTFEFKPGIVRQTIPVLPNRLTKPFRVHY